MYAFVLSLIVACLTRNNILVCAQLSPSYSEHEPPQLFSQEAKEKSNQKNFIAAHSPPNYIYLAT